MNGEKNLSALVGIPVGWLTQSQNEVVNWENPSEPEKLTHQCFRNQNLWKEAKSFPHWFRMNVKYAWLSVEIPCVMFWHYETQHVARANSSRENKITATRKAYVDNFSCKTKLEEKLLANSIFRHKMISWNNKEKSPNSTKHGLTVTAIKLCCVVWLLLL